MDNLFSELEWRGQVAKATEGARELLAREKVTAYVGFDPTAPSLHVGSLVPVMTLSAASARRPLTDRALGGGTGLIGDPSGKTAERTLQSREVVEANVDGIRAQLRVVSRLRRSPEPGAVRRQRRVAERR